MKSYLKVRYFGAAVILAMVVSLLTPIHATADDTIPPPVQTEEPPLVETEVPLPAEEEADGDESINEQEDEVVAPQNISEIIEQLPEGTGIHLETEEGVEPLVTAQAENLILVGDPIWCPDGVAPIPTVGGCSISYTSLEDLVNNFPDPGGPGSVPGVIWIMEGIDISASFISLDSANYVFWGGEDLVIQGGWNGDVLGTVSSTTTVNVPIEVIGWTGNITINDLIITGASGTGLSVDIDGDVFLNDLVINGNDGPGIYVESGGIVTAENIIANNNGLVSLSGYGAEIHGSELHLSGTNEFNGNYESGLYVSTTGDIEIENLTASNNGTIGYASGAELYSDSGDIDLLGVNQFMYNRNNGLYIEAFNGTIAAENITASNNGIGNSYASGAELIAASLDLVGNNVFMGNNNAGLFADISGDIAITNINASNNGIPGAYGPGAELYSTGMVTIMGMNVFSGNSSEGLVIDSGGNITLLNIDALNNDDSGLVFITNADTYVDCGSVLNNGGTQIDTAMPGGILTLAGVDFGGDPDQNVGIDASQLTLVSTMCFNYPDYYGEEGYGDGDLGGQKDISDPENQLFAVKYVSIVGGQDVNLDCAYYQATYILLDDGDGAIIPCPIVGSVKLDSVKEINSYGILPDKNKFVSGMGLTISGESQIFKPVNVTDIIWYFNGISAESGGYEAVYWNGTEWVDITDQIPPFLTIFFRVPKEFSRQNLAILYWDGNNWIELLNGTQLGQGRVVSGLGYSETGEYFQANVNFTGIFVLVQK